MATKYVYTCDRCKVEGTEYMDTILARRNRKWELCSDCMDELIEFLEEDNV